MVHGQQVIYNSLGNRLDDTEQEAIELIQSQVLQIKILKEQITQKDQELENFKLQHKQIEAYKQQIQNLKH